MQAQFTERTRRRGQLFVYKNRVNLKKKSFECSFSEFAKMGDQDLFQDYDDKPNFVQRQLSFFPFQPLPKIYEIKKTYGLQNIQNNKSKRQSDVLS